MTLMNTEQSSHLSLVLVMLKMLHNWKLHNDILISHIILNLFRVTLFQTPNGMTSSESLNGNGKN